MVSCSLVIVIWQILGKACEYTLLRVWVGTFYDIYVAGSQATSPDWQVSGRFWSPDVAILPSF